MSRNYYVRRGMIRMFDGMDIDSAEFRDAMNQINPEQNKTVLQLTYAEYNELLRIYWETRIKKLNTG